MKIDLNELFCEQDDVRLEEELAPRSIEVAGTFYQMTPELVRAELDFYRESSGSGGN